MEKKNEKIFLVINYMTIKKKIFYKLFINDLISNFGDSLYYLALMNYVILLQDNKLALSIVTLSETLPILFKIIMGYIADNTKNKVNSIIYTQLFRFCIYVLIGVIISFKPSLWIVIIISLLNFFSDLFGQLENSLYLPIEMQLIEEKEREQVFASTQSISSTLNIIFQLIGATLVTWISFHSLAFINAFTFLICAISMLFLKSYLNKLLVDIPKIASKKQNDNIIQDIKKAFKELQTIPILKEFLLIISYTNGLFSITSPLIVLIISQNKNFIIINSATTISLSSIIIAIGSILGNITATTILRKASLKYIILTSVSIIPLLFLSFIYQNIWSCFIVLFLLSVMGGNINPKFYGFLMSNLPTEKIGILSSSIGTIIQLGIIISQILFSLLIIYIPTTLVSYFYLTLSLLLIFYTVLPLLKSKES